ARVSQYAKILKTMRKLIFASTVAFAVASVVPALRADSSTSWGPVPAIGEVIEQVLVKVNGDIITKTELEQRQVAVLRQRMNGQVDPEMLKNDAQLKKMLAEITPQVLVNAVDE